MQYISVLQRKKKEFEEVDNELGNDLLNIFDTHIFTPIKDVLPKKVKYDGKEFPAIIKGLQNDNIKYIRTKQGFYIENITEKIAKELNEIGARYNSMTKIYELQYQQIPLEIKSVVSSKINEMESLTHTIDKLVLVGVAGIFASKINDIIKPKFEKTAEIAVGGIVEGLEKTIAKTDDVVAPKVIPTITKDDYFLEKYDDYIKTADKSIKGFTQKEIEDLRRVVADIRLRGGTVADVKEYLQKTRNLTENRMNLIAKQETKLANSAYEQDVCGKAGLRLFKWIHPNISKEPRQHHLEYARMSKEENFLFDSQNPPIDPKTNKPEMPGEPIGCNCHAVFVKEPSQNN